MIADANRFDELDFDQEVSARRAAPPIRRDVALTRRLEISGRQRQANRARFRRGSASVFNGSHRRRDKRSYL